MLIKKSLKPLAVFALITLQSIALITEARSAPIWEWYKYIFPVCWYGNDCFEPPRSSSGTPPRKQNNFPYSATLRVFCVDSNDPSQDRADNELTVGSKISVQDARNQATAQSQQRDVCKDDDPTRMMSPSKAPVFID